MKRLRRIAGQASPLVVGRLASAALTFALPLWLARVLDPVGFGTYKQLFLIAQTVLLTCQIGLTQSLYYFLPGGGRERGAFVTQVMVGLGTIGLVAGGVLWLGAPWIAGKLGDGSLATLRTPLALLSVGLLCAAPLEAALTSEGRVGWAALSYVISDGLRASLLCLGAAKGGVHGLAWGAAIFAGVRLTALALALVFGAVPTARPSWPRLRAQLAYALPFAGAILLYVAQKQFAQYAVSARFDPATFAMFAVAAFHLPVVDIVYSPLTEVLMVRIGQRRQSVRRATTPELRAAASKAVLAEWDDAVDKLASILWPATACAWLLGPEMLPMLFTHRYDASVPLFLLATFEIPLWVLPVDALLRAAGDTRFLFAWNGVRAALTAGLVLGGMHVLGIAGAILGGVISEGISRVIMLARGRRFLGTSLWGSVDRGGLVRIGAAAALATLPAWAVDHCVAGRTGIALAGVVYGLCYLGLRLAWHAPGRHPILGEAPAPEIDLEIQTAPPPALEETAPFSHGEPTAKTALAAPQPGA